MTLNQKKNVRIRNHNIVLHIHYVTRCIHWNISAHIHGKCYEVQIKIDLDPIVYMIIT